MTGDKKISTANEIKSTPPSSKSEEVVLSAKDLKVWEEGSLINFDLPKGEILGSLVLMVKDKIILLKL